MKWPRKLITSLLYQMYVSIVHIKCVLLFPHSVHGCSLIPRPPFFWLRFIPSCNQIKWGPLKDASMVASVYLKEFLVG